MHFLKSIQKMEMLSQVNFAGWELRWIKTSARRARKLIPVIDQG
jgi:hypothetical protein